MQERIDILRATSDLIYLKLCLLFFARINLPSAINMFHIIILLKLLKSRQHVFKEPILNKTCHKFAKIAVYFKPKAVFYGTQFQA